MLVVEGMKCRRAAAAELPGYVVVTWNGGAARVAAAPWELPAGDDVTVDPDYDEAGLCASKVIKRRLPQARILRIDGTPQGWDAADAVAEGIDLAAFVRDCPTREVLPEHRVAEDILAEAGVASSGATAEARRILAPILQEAERRIPDLHMESSGANEAAAAHDFAGLFSGSLLWVKGASWRGYDSSSGLWVRDRDALLVSRCAVCAAEVRRKFIGLTVNPREAERFVRALLTRKGIRDVVEIAKSEPVLQANRGEFDTDLDAVLDEAGQHIDLRTGVARPATSGDRHSKHLGVAYDPRAGGGRGRVPQVGGAFDRFREVVDVMRTIQLAGHRGLLKIGENYDASRLGTLVAPFYSIRGRVCESYVIELPIRIPEVISGSVMKTVGVAGIDRE